MIFGLHVRVNPLSPHDALKHHLTSLKTDLIFVQPRVLEWIFLWNWFTNTIFFNFSPTSNHLHPLQVENCDSNSLLVVNEDDNDKFRLQRVNGQKIAAVTIYLIHLFRSLVKMNHVAQSVATVYRQLILPEQWKIYHIQYKYSAFTMPQYFYHLYLFG